MELKQSNVIFSPVEHTYTLNGKELSGVTALLKRQLGDRYGDVPDEILNKAKNRGHEIHSKIEFYDSLDIDVDDADYKAYKDLIASKGLTRLANELLVSDEEYIASSIDVVFEDCSIADIKTTSKIDMEYVTWQLSIYAYLLELMNPDFKVNKLYVIWLPKQEYGNPQIVEIVRHSAEEAKAMIDADKRGEIYQRNTLSIPPKVIDAIIEVEQQIKSLKEQEREFRDKLLQMMQEQNIKSFKSDKLILTRKLSSVSERLDTSKLKAEFPEIYSKCLKQVITEETLMIKI